MLMMYDLAIYFCYGFLKLFTGLKIEGRKELRGLSSFILVSNHISNLDPVVLALAVYPYKLRFMAKQELFKNKFFSLFLSSLGAFPVRRGSTDLNSIRKVLNFIKKRPVLIFPQGTRSAEFDKLNYGAGFLCRKAAAPVIAAKLYGTDEVLPKYARFFRKGKIKVVLSRLESIDYSLNHKAITDSIIERIKAL